jgi:flavorubredoxin
MAESVAAGAEGATGVRVSLYDIEGGEVAPFVDLIEEADGLAFGSPTINGDAVKPVWDLLSSLTAVNVRGKLGAAFGSYGWSGEAVPMVEDRLRGLKLRVPVQGVRARLIPTADELADCHALGRALALHLTGRQESTVIDMAALA